MSYKIVVATSFERDLKPLKKKYPSIKSDLAEVIAQLKVDPFSGVPLGKNCYKIRMSIASKGRGKRGGARVITCVKVINEIVYLFTVFDKSDKESIEDQELMFLLESAGLM
jgi:mRNA-degrading endonuclease RelE of RelBE toxin-antitoxin system